MKLLERDPELVPDAIGHRMAHGGPNFKQHVILDDAVMAELERIQELAPIHNPPAVRLVAACRRLYPNLPETVVFDTVFHATIPEVARGLRPCRPRWWPSTAFASMVFTAPVTNTWRRKRPNCWRAL